METADLLSLIQGVLALGIAGLIWPLVSNLRSASRVRQRRTPLSLSYPDQVQRLAPRRLRREG